MSVGCPYCGGEAKLVDSKTVYRTKSYGKIWLCFACNAYVGVHRGTTKPLGRLANAELRAWKVKAHAAFDPFWRDLKTVGRSQAYHRLAADLGIEPKNCHIGMFDVDLCKRVIEVCGTWAANVQNAAPSA